jgi:hypothetical protein
MGQLPCVSCSSSVPFDSHALDPHNTIERARTDEPMAVIASFLYNNKSRRWNETLFFLWQRHLFFSLCRYNTERTNEEMTHERRVFRVLRIYGPVHQPSSTFSPACQFSIRFSYRAAKKIVRTARWKEVSWLLLSWTVKKYEMSLFPLLFKKKTQKGSPYLREDPVWSFHPPVEMMVSVYYVISGHTQFKKKKRH